MDWIPTRLSFRETGYFSKIITDYLDRADTLAPFYAHPVSLKGICDSLEGRQQSPVNREVLVAALKDQYAGEAPAPRVKQNIDLLATAGTFTVCTAHQPAIFTGSLYFIYKILHTIKLAAHLSSELPQYRFVPVFYMGSEDADLEELGKIYLDQEKLVWDTRQTGAVGRMKPAGLEKIMQRIEGEYSVQPFGKELIGMLREAYLGSPDIQTGTFRLIHKLFAEYGLVVLIPDRASLKELMIPVFMDDLFEQTPSKLVDETIGDLSQHYKVQANPRAINLFYLKDDLRGRIEKVGDRFVVHDSRLTFGEQEMKDELHRYPERFSPNVILRGLFQEMILPNIAFIGGGGETAYWLEFRKLFAHYKVSFPVLILRNSFLLVEEEWDKKLAGAGVTVTDIFRPEEELVNELVRRHSQQQLSLGEEIAEAGRFYGRLKKLSEGVDSTLRQHVEALEAKAMVPLKELEKKLLKAEKRKFSDQRRQLHTIQAALFPLKGLQERIDNFLPWYAKRGRKFLDDLYVHSPVLEQEFVILAERS